MQATTFPIKPYGYHELLIIDIQIVNIISQQCHELHKLGAEKSLFDRQLYVLTEKVTGVQGFDFVHNIHNANNSVNVE